MTEKDVLKKLEQLNKKNVDGKTISISSGQYYEL